MFISYHGNKQRFDPSSRKAAYRHRARRPGKATPLNSNISATGFQLHLDDVDDTDVPTPASSQPTPSSIDARQSTPVHFEDDDDDVEEVVDSSKELINLIDAYRGDPFEAFPVASRPYFQPAIDFYTAIISPEYAPRVYGFSFAVQHEIVFEATLTFTLCVMPNTGPWAQTAMLQHHGSTLVKLNKTLASKNVQEATSDAVLITIATLIAANAALNHNEQLMLHLKGLRQIVKLRGGIDALGAGGKLKGLVLGVESLAHHFPDDDSKSESSSRRDLDDPTMKSFPKDVAAIIKQLPEGLQEMALDWRLSFHFLRAIGSPPFYMHLEKTKYDQVAEWNKTEGFFSPMERMVWASLLVYHLHSRIPKDAVTSLAQWLLFWQPSELHGDSDWTIWACLVMMGSSETLIDAKTAQALRRRLMALFPHEASDFGHLQAIASKFFWEQTWNITAGSQFLQMMVEHEESQTNNVSAYPTPYSNGGLG